MGHLSHTAPEQLLFEPCSPSHIERNGNDPIEATVCRWHRLIVQLKRGSIQIDDCEGQPYRASILREDVAPYWQRSRRRRAMLCSKTARPRLAWAPATPDKSAPDRAEVHPSGAA